MRARLSGSQAGRRRLVGVMLERALADPHLFDSALDPREETFRLFSLFWNAMPIHGFSAERASTPGLPDQRLEAHHARCRGRRSC